MSARSTEEPPLARICIAGFVSWVVPGAGHLYVGDRARGIILMITIAATFWMGMAIGGAHDTVNPDKRFPWFLAQICTGGHGLTAYAWGQNVRPPKTTRNESIPPRNPSFASIDTAVVYTGIAGLLNLLVILDAIGRAEQSPAIAASRRRKSTAAGSSGQEKLA